VAALAGGHKGALTALRNIRTDLDRYLRRIGRA
jgi:hypothetical protein